MSLSKEEKDVKLVELKTEFQKLALEVGERTFHCFKHEEAVVKLTDTMRKLEDSYTELFESKEEESANGEE